MIPAFTTVVIFVFWVVARCAQFARLVEWAREVSEKTGVPLPNL